MYTITKEYIYTYEIKRSKFISRLFPIKDVDEANEILTKIRKLHYDATHNCYSYILGNDQETYKNSDDGEPSQTAGVPIYEVLKKNNLTNVLCIVTRYYGKIKLGAGGLIRAYSEGASSVLKIANLEEIIDYTFIKLTFNYDVSNEVFKELDLFEAISKDFSSRILCVYKVPTNDIDKLTKQLINITRDNIQIEIINK